MRCLGNLKVWSLNAIWRLQLCSSDPATPQGPAPEPRLLCLFPLVTQTAWAGLISLPDAWLCFFSHWKLKSPSHLHSNPMPGQASQVSHIHQRSGREKGLIFISICASWSYQLLLSH